MFSLEKIKLGYDLTEIYKYVKEGCKEDGGRLRAQTETQGNSSEYQETLLLL